MNNLESLVKVSIIILCLSVTYKVLTFRNSGRYDDISEKQLLDTETGIISMRNKSNTTLHPFFQVNPSKGEVRFFLDGKWDNWIKFENNTLE